jgi:hypothetical protein
VHSELVDKLRELRGKVQERDAILQAVDLRHVADGALRLRGSDDHAYTCSEGQRQGRQCVIDTSIIGLASDNLLTSPPVEAKAVNVFASASSGQMLASSCTSAGVRIRAASVVMERSERQWTTSARLSCIETADRWPR